MVEGALPAEAASDGSPRGKRRVFRQLWFWVLVAIVAGVIFGLVAPDTAEKSHGWPTRSSSWSRR